MTVVLPGTSPYLAGLHEPAPNAVMPAGWILFLSEVGHSPEPHPGVDYSEWADQGYGTICRLQYRWGNQAGTLPRPEHLDGYVQRVRTLVANSRGCSRWIVGNEPGNAVEWPDGWPLEPEYVAFCYDRCWQAIHDLSGHEFDEVLLPPIGPWNDDTGIGWIEYFQRMMAAVEFLDGFAIHAYTHGSDPALITSEAMMNPPHQNRHYEFRVYRDWMKAIPMLYWDLPVYLTETNQDGPWLDERNGWVTEMYREINAWNQSGSQVIRCACLYRWPHYDDYYIEGKSNVIADFQAAQAHEYKWTNKLDPPEEDTLLLNPSFEGEWYEQTPDGILVLPEHWRAEYREHDNPYKRPEIKPNQEFTTHGQWSIRAFPPEHSRGFYGIYQEVESQPGQWYKFSADVRLESKPSGRLAAFAGIQPWGASIFARQMVWGEETQEQLEWKRVEVIAQAFGGKIRVAMGAENEFASRNNTTWWDNAKLELWECNGTDPEPPDPEPPTGECKLDWERMAKLVEAVTRFVVSDELDKSAWTRSKLEQS